MKATNDHTYHHPARRQTAIQLIKYVIVGGMNTVLTLAVIFCCKSLLDINPYVSNGIGYFVGLINSFLWNRSWVFRAKDGTISRQAVRFMLGFFLCYGIQLLAVWALNQYAIGGMLVDICGFTLSGYGIATLIGNVVYSGCNFVYNKVVAFR